MLLLSGKLDPAGRKYLYRTCFRQKIMSVHSEIWGTDSGECSGVFVTTWWKSPLSLADVSPACEVRWHSSPWGFPAWWGVAALINATDSSLHNHRETSLKVGSINTQTQELELQISTLETWRGHCRINKGTHSLYTVGSKCAASSATCYCKSLYKP